ncbi:MAG: FecR family protein [Candidatus Zambryskibacteria bacterium]|nr:FecR family protein [Candidatus Zambryskibacteria bacterium]
MITRIIVILLIVLGVGAGGYTLVKNKGVSTPSTSDKSGLVDEKAWIEVLSGSILNKTSEPVVELKSGDLLVVGSIIETGPSGHGNIHFPDGSILRLDKETTVTLSQINFKKDSHSLIVKISLGVGRVWSKVISLATPDSVWEVKTSNTVATVRGTAFGMSYKNNLSWVLGSENKIAVAPIDPDTGKTITTSEVIIKENQVIEISQKDVLEAKSTTAPTLNNKVMEASSAILNDPWIKNVKEEDRIFDLNINNTKLETNQNNPIEKTVNKIETPIKPTIPSSLPQGELLVIANKTLGSVIEGETVTFRATQNNQDVTSKVKWNVIGQIGQISPGGIFTAQLGNQVSEFGEAVGYVIANFENSKDVSKSELIKVIAAPVETPINIGGQ